MPSNLTREQANELAQKLANENDEPFLIWFVPTRFKVDDRYRVVSQREASESSKSHSVDCKWPMEA